MNSYRGQTTAGDFFVKNRRLYLEFHGDVSFTYEQIHGRKLVRWDQDAFTAAQRSGILAPHPVFAEYDWAGSEPFEAQCRTAEFLLFYERAFVLSEMGTGKTRAALYAFDALRQWRAKAEGARARGLIVAPLSTLGSVWAREVEETFSGRLCATILHGSLEQRLRRLAGDQWNLAVINHDYVGAMLPQLQRARFDVVIVDELAAFRNAKTTRATALRALTSGRGPAAKIVGPPMRWVWGLTGTPTPTAPTDAWGLKRIVRPGEEGSFLALQRQTMRPASGPGGFLKWSPKPGWHDVIARYLVPAVRFSRSEMLDLPPTTWSKRATTLTPEQKVKLRELQKYARATFGTASVTAVNAAVVVNKYLQICLGSVIDDASMVQNVNAYPRDQLLLELVADAPEKVLVFATYRAAVTRVFELLRRAGHAVAIVHGDVAAEERERIFTSFQTTPAPRVIVAHPATMAHGLTLTAASTIIWFGPVWSAEIYSQACARITRIGQANHTHIIDIYATPLERRAYELVRTRLTEQEVLLGLYEKLLDE